MSSLGFISNYFPLVDILLKIAEIRFVDHRIRVVIMLFKKTKFIWSNWDGRVELFLYTDPIMIKSNVRMMPRPKQQLRL